MKITGHPLFDSEGKLDQIQITLCDKEAIASFQELLFKALNTNWEKAPPEWKELADRIEHGKVLQDYYLIKR
jgi:hypothetical protein